MVIQTHKQIASEKRKMLRNDYAISGFELKAEERTMNKRGTFDKKQTVMILHTFFLIDST